MENIVISRTFLVTSSVSWEKLQLCSEKSRFIVTKIHASNNPIFQRTFHWKIELMNFFKVVKRFSLPPDANMIWRNVIYKVKLNDDLSLNLKAKLCTDPIEDVDKAAIKAGNCVCSTLGILVLLLISSINEEWLSSMSRMHFSTQGLPSWCCWLQRMAWGTQMSNGKSNLMVQSPR